ncbi:MAG: alanine--tRNA ligase [Bacteroidales bacterium]|nr:alanine--tRNA ligase [Bacteroidales bacterium]
MNSSQVRKTFLEFFNSKKHHIVQSAPMVVKNDPTLMFVNAGMNQFKDVFLGNSPTKFKRVTDTQKCLRVSGKHNDLEEVGRDTYHHTMFEMLGNWSFGDYFKKEAIEWAWELLTDVFKINKNNLYVTVFEGDKNDNLQKDEETYSYWKNIVTEDNILNGSKKDNFWEMGNTGPCGPCSEIHIDIRSEEDKVKIPGKELVNKDHPEVIEIWNLVFIEFNRNANGKLEPLPAKHVDTGLGFERLCMVMQGVRSNYDTDVFQPLIKEIEKLSSKKYGDNDDTNIAMRVIADHLRAVVFAIGDGQLPSNTGAGYVIRRILRRAVRYGYTFLEFPEAFIYKLVPLLVNQMGDTFPEIRKQEELIRKVIAEEEIAFLRTLFQGIKKFDQYISRKGKDKIIDGGFAFELFDTFGFPIDLTQLMTEEKGWTVDMKGFEKGLKAQKERSKKAATVKSEDWIILSQNNNKSEFTGYEKLTAEAEVIKYRKVKTGKNEFFEIVLDKTPFYAESGGQVGDKGYFLMNDDKIFIDDTKTENNLIIHITKKIPQNISKNITAVVNSEKRQQTANNHTATHLLHSALKEVLGNHVEQKGSLVEPNRLRFDFSHFSKLSDKEIKKVEKIVNQKIRQNIQLDEKRNIPFNEAKKMGATALFGEKYGDTVRVITFDKNFSVELCGGTHVNATGEIGVMKLISESAIAAGIRRIEAITAEKAEEYIIKQFDTINKIKELTKNPNNLISGIQNLIEQNSILQKEINKLNKGKVNEIINELSKKAEKISGVNFISAKLDIDINTAKDIAFNLNKKVKDMFLVLGTTQKSKANLTIMISENIIKNKKLHAGNIIMEISKEIKGGGGGQAHFASAGGKDPQGIENAIKLAKTKIR